VQFLEKTVLWFREEALKLASKMKELKDSNQSLLKRIELLEKETAFFKDQAIAAKRYSKILKQSLASLKQTTTSTRQRDEATSQGRPAALSLSLKSPLRGGQQTTTLGQSTSRDASQKIDRPATSRAD